MKTDRIAAQVRYHLELAAQTASTGEVDRSAPEAILAWAVASVSRVLGDPSGAPDDLPLVPPWPAGADGAKFVREGEQLAMQMEAHYTSEGHFDLASVYADAAASLRSLLHDG